MAVLDENRAPPPQKKIMKVVKTDDKKVYLVAQELKLAKVLAGNDKKARDRALKNLKAWFAKRTQTMPFTQEDFQRIWKGLFYSMWMSDKPLVQEECAENISKLVQFPTLDTSLMFFQAGLIILSNEWFGIDQHRLDKFLMLVRRLLRQMLFALKNNSFKLMNITKFNDILSDTILNVHAEPPLGLLMHFVDIFMEELAKVSEGKIDSNLVVEFIKPFVKKMVTLHDGRLIDHIRKNIFTYLIEQSDLGLEYQEKYVAWSEQGFPGSINSMQKVKLDEDEMMSADEEGDEVEESNDLTPGEKPLDPRAGRVDVELPQIKFNAIKIVEILNQYKFDPKSTTKSRKTIKDLIVKFNKLSQGTYPSGPKRLNVDNIEDRIDIRKEAKKLIKFEQKLMGKGKKRKMEVGHGDAKKVKVMESNGFSDENNTDYNKEIDSMNVLEKNRNKREKNPEIVSKVSKESVALNEKFNNKKNFKRPTNNVGEAAETKNAKRKKIDSAIVNDGKEEIVVKNVNQTKKNSTVSDEKCKSRKQSIIDNIECIFERNSGTWIVFDDSKGEKPPIGVPGGTESGNWTTENAQFNSLEDPKSTPSTSGRSIKIPKTSPHQTNEKQLQEKSLTLPSTSGRSPKKFKKSPEKVQQPELRPVSSTPTSSPEKLECGTPKSGISPVRLFETPPNPKKEVFPDSPWEEPLQEGEYEICIPSKKYLAKQKKVLGNRAEPHVHTILNNAIKKIKGKSRVSLDPNLLRDPFSKGSVSTKKVKFNIKLNKSQEVYEHHLQVRRSPGIPYDSTKKPSKPLLKRRMSTTPVNPFYSKQLSFC